MLLPGAKEQSHPTQEADGPRLLEHLVRLGVRDLQLENVLAGGEFDIAITPVRPPEDKSHL